MKPRLLALAAAVLMSATSALAVADPLTLPPIPPEVWNSPIIQSILNSLGGLTQTTNGNTAVGRVSYFRHFDLQVQTAPSVYRAVHLHQGTIINPRGTTLSQGMWVNVTGSAQHDGSLNADSITAR